MYLRGAVENQRRLDGQKFSARAWLASLRPPVGISGNSGGRIEQRSCHVALVSLPPPPQLPAPCTESKSESPTRPEISRHLPVYRFAVWADPVFDASARHRVADPHLVAIATARDDDPTAGSYTGKRRLL